MPESLSTFLTNVAQHPADMQKFRADPHDAMAKAGLSSGDMVAVLSRKPSLISQAIKAGNGGLAAAADADTTVVVVVL